MSAETLRKAAALMRERATAATDGPWIHNTNGYVFGRIPGDEVAGGVRRNDADHIASWHPAVALAVADWLDEVAAHHDSWAISRGLQPVARRALTVARAYLGKSA